jgi:nucleotide-binding universal stress UspA family protein
MKDIIVGVDRTPTARIAAEHAAELAATFRVNLHVVMCLEAGSPDGREPFRIDSLSEADRFLDELTGALPYDKITHIVGVGEAADMLCKEADRLAARVIVVGNPRLGSAPRALGSVASDVARQASCDVLMVST